MAALAAVPPLQVVAQRPLLAQPLQVLVAAAAVLLVRALLALALLAKDVVVRVQLLLLVPRPLLAQAPREAAVAARGGGAANPIVLSRNGRNFTVTGATNVRAGTEIKAETQAPSVSINLSELDSGSWVIFELPGFTTAATGTAQNSLDALRSATSTSYYKGEGALWVKVVSSRRPRQVVAVVAVAAGALSKSASKLNPAV